VNWKGSNRAAAGYPPFLWINLLIAGAAPREAYDSVGFLIGLP
jgi:hypothetical protein